MPYITKGFNMYYAANELTAKQIKSLVRKAPAVFVSVGSTFIRAYKKDILADLNSTFSDCSGRAISTIEGCDNVYFC